MIRRPTVLSKGRLSLIHGNALTLPLADQSVHLIVSSPPYFALRSYRDGDEHYTGQLGSESTPLHFLAALWRVMDECWRVLRDDGSCWINLGDKFAGSGNGPQGGALVSRDLAAARECVSGDRQAKRSAGLRPKSRMLLPHLFAAGCEYPWLRRAVEQEACLPPTVDPPQWIVRMDAVWSKVNGLPESVTDRVRASHEYWFHMTKSGIYFAALDEIREDDPKSTELERRLLAAPGSVWSVSTEPLRIPDHLPQHFAAFPSEFPRRIVLGWSPSGICVACGQPRRPVCEKGLQVRQRHLTDRQDGNGDNHWGTSWRTLGGASEVSITGYACSCPTPNAAATPATVLDPFSGTGTTAIVAAALGRHGIAVDLSWDYHRIARWRDEDGRLAAKALGLRPAKKAKRKPAGMVEQPLFEMTAG